MRYSSFSKRAKAYLMDYLIVSMPIMIVISFMAFSFLKDTGILSVYPFILLMLVFCPYFMLGYLVLYPEINDILLVLASIAAIVILESIIYTLMEIFFNGQTIGKSCNDIRLYNTTLLKLFIRNILKSASKYFLFIPYFTVFVTKEKQTAYDLLLGTYVVDK